MRPWLVWIWIELVEIRQNIESSIKRLNSLWNLVSVNILSPVYQLRLWFLRPGHRFGNWFSGPLSYRRIHSFWAPYPKMARDDLTYGLLVTFLLLTSATGNNIVILTVSAQSTVSGMATNPTSTAPDNTSSAVSEVVLSKNAIIGIAVGGCVFLLLAAVLFGCCCWKCCWKTRRNRKAVDMNAYESYRTTGPRMPLDNLQKVEMGVTENVICELPAR